MKGGTHIQVLAPPVVFALALHGALNLLFGVPVHLNWLVAVVAFQCLILALWATGRVSAPFALAGAALTAVIVDLFVTVLYAVGTGGHWGFRVAGAGAALAAAFGALWLSHSLAARPGFDFSPSRASHAPDSALSGGTPAAALSAAAAPVKEGGRAKETGTAGSIGHKTPAWVPGPAGSGPVPRKKFFRIVHNQDGQLLASCPCSDLEGSVDLASLRDLLPDYDPSSVCVIKVSLATDDSVVIRVDGRLKSGKELYRLLEPPKE